ncbi:HigA family addiction module antitoxin [Methylocapsa sp. S129]|uniref:HigA family addiction module antitoxin n=1 Tax=Methylocapsa sp. S129 TaxID=1641869 RepID=UPI00131EB99D|nr:HigA family addiction module antitoxin [Methylocapsa sp. S129]
MPENVEIVATLPPMHPGEMLREEYLKPLHLSAGALAKSCGVPRTRIERIASEKLGITGDTAIRLARVLGTTPEFWMNLQSRYEIGMAFNEVGDIVERLRPLEIAA